MGVSNISKKVMAEKAPVVDPTTGLMVSEKEEIAQTLALADAEKKIEAEALPSDVKDMLLQEIKLDGFNTLRRYVRLTPSMCDVRGCGWDAAKEAGSSDWHSIPVDQVMPDGKTLGERLQGMLAYHKATAHTYSAQNDHLISEAELRNRQWAPGQEVHLTGAR